MIIFATPIFLMMHLKLKLPTYSAGQIAYFLSSQVNRMVCIVLASDYMTYMCG